MERLIGGSRSGDQIGSANEVSVNVPDSPLVNNLILEKILSYLPMDDLKKSRLVCKKWGEEGSKVIAKKATVSFELKYDSYLKPENSTKVARYILEMGNLKIRNLQISLQPSQEEYWELYPYRRPMSPFLPKKMLDDLRKLLKSSSNVSTLFLEAYIRKESDFSFFAAIFQELGGNLVELTLDGKIQYFPEALPSLPSMANLKKFSYYGSIMIGIDNKLSIFSLLFPLFSKRLEHITCGASMIQPYLQGLLAMETLKLMGVSIKGWIGGTETSLLLTLKNPLTVLEVHCSPQSEEENVLLERLLYKQSGSLQSLVIGIEVPRNKGSEIKLPRFPNLKVLTICYGIGTRIGWEMGLNYKTHFPSLRTLTISPRDGWSKDDYVVNAFFPEQGNMRCESVKEFWIPVLQNPKLPPYYWPPPVPEPEFKEKMDQIMATFPGALKLNFVQ